MKKLSALFMVIILVGGGCTTSEKVSALKCTLSSHDYWDNFDRASETYRYNESRQLIGLIYKDGTGDHNVDISYSSGQVIVKANPAPTYNGFLSATYTLNSAGYISKIAEIFLQSRQPENRTSFFEYNTDGYLQKITNTYNVTTIEYLNGNRLNEKYYDSNGKLSSTTIYTYYENKPAVLPTLGVLYNFDYSFESIFRTIGMFGKVSKNPIKQYKYNQDITTDFTHNYDVDGNITNTVEKATNFAGIITTSNRNFTYKCQN